MKIESSGDLIYWTYYMLNWDQVHQTPSDQHCSECGEPMNKTEPAVDARGNKYDGYVCHKDKKLVWVRAG